MSCKNFSLARMSKNDRFLIFFMYKFIKHYGLFISYLWFSLTTSNSKNLALSSTPRLLNHVNSKISWHHTELHETQRPRSGRASHSPPSRTRRSSCRFRALVIGRPRGTHAHNSTRSVLCSTCIGVCVRVRPAAHDSNLIKHRGSRL